jgi:hypothetical protein
MLLEKAAMRGLVSMEGGCSVHSLYMLVVLARPRYLGYSSFLRLLIGLQLWAFKEYVEYRVYTALRAPLQDAHLVFLEELRQFKITLFRM